MPLSAPLPFREALLKVDITKIVPSTLSHEELSAIAAEIRERTFTAARVANAEALQRLRDSIRKVVSGEISESEARAKLLDIGLPPSRIDLIVETQVGMARGYGQWRQSQNTLKSFPAWEFFRAEERVEPRDWPERWAKAGGSFYPGESDYPDGRMVALINDPIWEQISAFGSPFAPFDFNSGMWTRRVSMREALELGLLETPDDAPEAEDREFDEDEQYDAGSLDDDLREALLDSLGDQYQFDEEGVLTVANRLANAEFREEQHPRDSDGKFAVKDGTEHLVAAGRKASKDASSDEERCMKMYQLAHKKLKLDTIKGIKITLHFGVPPTFNVNNTEMETAGDYNPKTHEIRLYWGAFESQEVLEGVLAHETMHHRFNESRDREANMPLSFRPKVEAAISRNLLALQRTDGITDYSKEYWKEFMRVGGDDMFDRAIDETLAELNRLKQGGTGKFNTAHASWKKLYKAVLEESSK